MVHFVGAGSGAVDLITVRGAKLLGQADIVIYAGSLVNPEVLGYTGEGCRIYDSATMTLEEVLDVIKAGVADGKSIVRLHTGDSSIYGAVREQFDELDALGIPYTVCPGVSSFCGAAASLKAEYTLPDVSQTVIISRMEGRTAVPAKESMASLARHGATMILFLSMGVIDELQAALLEGGYSPDTPTAIVYKATWPEEKIFRCPLSDLAATAKANHISKTALVTVGGFLGDHYLRSKLYSPDFSTEYRQATL